MILSTNERFHRAAVRVPFALLLVVFAVMTTGCKKRNSGAAPTREHPLAVRVTTVRYANMRQTVDYVGTVRSVTEVKVLSRLAGSVIQMPYKESDKVKKGKLLVRLGVPDLYQRTGRVRAEIDKARVDADYVCQQAKIDAKLYAEHAIPKVRYDASQSRCNAAKKGLLVANFSLGEVGAMSGKSVERAPFDGKVLQRFTEPGEHAFPGKPLLLYGSLDLELRVGVGERDISQGVGVGTKAIVRFRQGGSAVEGKSFEVEVTRVAPMATGPGRTVEVGLRLPDELSNDLPHGASADVSFVLREQPDACGVPREGVRIDRIHHKTMVYELVGNKAKEVPVKLGVRDRGFVAIEPKLPKGTKVVISNLDVVMDGTELYPVLVEKTVTP